MRTRPDYATPPNGTIVEVTTQVPKHTDWMDLALAEARLAEGHGDVPVGAVLIDAEGVVVASNHNRREGHGDATAHAEMLAAVVQTAMRRTRTTTLPTRYASPSRDAR